MDNAIGELYGSTFEVDSGGKLLLQKPNFPDDATGDGGIRLVEACRCFKTTSLWHCNEPCSVAVLFHSKQTPRKQA